MQNTFHDLLMKSYFAFHHEIMTRAKQLGLTPGQPKVLEFLIGHAGAEQKDIAGHCEIAAASIGSILNRMELSGLIERKRLGGNRRSLYVFLTEKGRRAAEQVKAAFDEAERTAFSGMTGQETEALCLSLKKVYGNLTR